MKKYSMVVFSRPVEGREDEYLEWYKGQHIHDLLDIPGFVGCRFYKTADQQLIGTRAEKSFPYLMIWDWETDDVEQLMQEIDRRKKDGRSRLCPAFAEQLNYICMPLIARIDADETQGMTVQEVRAIYEEKREF